MKRMKSLEASYKACFWSAVGIAIVIALALLTSCKSVEYVPMPETHTEHHWHTDSVHTTDSIYHEKETTIMQLDSAAMAQYGIQLKAAERAWLVKSKELERQIQQLMQLSQTKDTVRDSIPVPYPVVKMVEKELSWMQKTLIAVGILALIAIVIIVALWLKKHCII